MSFCVTFALYEFMNFVSFVYLICSVWVDELCETFALMWLCWPFTSSWGVSICFDLLICTRSVLTPFLERSCVFVSIVSSCCPFLWELRLLILRDLVFAFSLGFWISWMSFVFILLLLVFFIWWNCVGCCQCTHQGRDWGPMVVTLRWWVIDNVMWIWCISWLVICRCRMRHGGRRRMVKIRRKIHAEG